MRFLFGCALFAVLFGLGLGLLLRSMFGRRFFGSLTLISLTPLLAHAIYLFQISWRAGAQAAYLLGFGAATLVLVAVFAVMARRWIRHRPWLTVFAPIMAGLTYVLLVILMWSFGLNRLDVEPNAIAGAAAGQACIGLAAALMAFVPLPASTEGKGLRMPWQRR